MRKGPRLAKKGKYARAVAIELRQIAPLLIELAEILETFQITLDSDLQQNMKETDK